MYPSFTTMVLVYLKDDHNSYGSNSFVTLYIKDLISTYYTVLDFYRSTLAYRNLKLHTKGL